MWGRFTFQIKTPAAKKPSSIPFTRQLKIVPNPQTIHKITSVLCSALNPKALINQLKYNFQTIYKSFKITISLPNHTKTLENSTLSRTHLKSLYIIRKQHIRFIQEQYPKLSKIPVKLIFLTSYVSIKTTLPPNP